MRFRTTRLAAGFVMAGLLAAAATLSAQPPGGTPAPPSGPVVIKRQGVQLLAPERYKVPMMLQPLRSVDLAAVTDGLVDALRVKPGDKVAEHGEVAQLDRREEQFLVERAKAHLRAAEAELRIAKEGKGGKDVVERAQAQVDAAKAEVELMQLRYDRASIKSPFAGQVFRVPVVEGQYVRAGQTLATIGDTSKLKVEIPLDRTKVKAGDTIDLKVEDRTVPAKVEAVLPLDERFAPLRDLVSSVASAVVVIDNARGEHLAGQTVFAPLVPRNPVTEVPNSALANGENGSRKVQVVRGDVVRDVPVETLGQVGADRVYVSGPFAADDEVIVSLSQPLTDGTQIRAAAAPPAAGPSTAGQPGPPNPPPPQNKAAF